MNRLVLLALMMLVLSLPLTARADDGDVKIDGAATILVGEPFTIIFEIRTSEAADVELDAASAWGRVELLGVEDHQVETDGVGALHRFEVLLTSFEIGQFAVAPALTITEGDQVVRRSLTPAVLTVAPTLSAEEPLVLSALSAPRASEGGQSPWLVPGVIAGGLAGALLLWGLIIVLIRRVEWNWTISGPPDVTSEPAEETAPLEGAEGLLADDPVAAYRIIGQSVRRALTLAYDIPVASMTTDELHRRLEPGGVDSWIVRMATDLLSQCDAVVYAGYRPALERRLGDLNVAGEILRAAA